MIIETADDELMTAAMHSWNRVEIPGPETTRYENGADIVIVQGKGTVNGVDFDEGMYIQAMPGESLLWISQQRIVIHVSS